MKKDSFVVYLRGRNGGWKSIDQGDHCRQGDRNSRATARDRPYYTRPA
ncbi:MAG TPA: hypothetical protein VKR06_12490 [Ktedonosporobacter sp.]|nr:hypothetical protein [Ktedonosporobacter sp.]